MKVVDLVTIDKLIPIYKNGEEANSIQVARIKDVEGNECQFNIIVGKGLYSIGDKAIYIQPDYCVPPGGLFNEYYAPGGDPSKSKLGKNGRIRAAKFNFQFAYEPDSIYSNGILIPYDECVKAFIEFDLSDVSVDLQKLFGVIKYEAPDSSDAGSKAGLTEGDRPGFLYETDEDRIELHKGKIDNCYAENERIGITVKRDGSSITIFCKNDFSADGPDHFPIKVGICSRKQLKKMDQTYVQAYKDGEYELHPYVKKETMERGWYNEFTQKFYTIEEVKDLEPVIVEARDAWVDTVKKHGYLSRLMIYCQNHNVELALRGELIGGGMKGSGNKLNKDAIGETDVVWFGVDDLSTDFSKRLHYGCQHNLKTVGDALGLKYTQPVFEGMMSYAEIIHWSNEYFKKVKDETGQIVEGIVVRSLYTNKISCKYINPEYDSKS